MAKVLSLVGDFPNPWKKIQDEIKQIGAKHWSPTVDDFYAIAGSGAIKCSHFHELLAAIYNNPPGSLAQVSVLTHGSRGSIPLKGTVHKRTGIVTLNHNTALNDTVLQSAETLEFKFVNKRTRRTVKFTLADVKTRFAKNAKIVFYACNSGTDLLLLQNVANTFNVPALGFSKELVYCPSFKTRPPKIDRRWIDVGSCTSPKRKLSLLNPDRQTKTKKANP